MPLQHMKGVAVVTGASSRSPVCLLHFDNTTLRVAWTPIAASSVHSVEACPGPTPRPGAFPAAAHRCGARGHRDGGGGGASVRGPGGPPPARRAADPSAPPAGPIAGAGVFLPGSRSRLGGVSVRSHLHRNARFSSNCTRSPPPSASNKLPDSTNTPCLDPTSATLRKIQPVRNTFVQQTPPARTAKSVISVSI